MPLVLKYCLASSLPASNFGVAPRFFIGVEVVAVSFASPIRFGLGELCEGQEVEVEIAAVALGVIVVSVLVFLLSTGLLLLRASIMLLIAAFFNRSSSSSSSRAGSPFLYSGQ